jgi:acetyltransferase-like isoleucine patch superfamily enzyme
MRQCDASPRALSLLIERLEIIDGSYADDPSFNGSELPTPQKVIKGDRTRLENFHVDVRRDQQKRTYVRIGDECLIGGTVVFERGLGSLTIGNRTSIGGGSLLICTQPDGISIGSNVMLSWNVTLIDSNSHSLDPDIRANDAFDWLVGLETGRLGLYKDWSSVKSAPIVIKDNAWIGFGSSIMKGVTIGEGAVIGANSVVTKDVPDGAIVAGNPAKIIGTVPGRLGQPISQG